MNYHAALAYFPKITYQRYKKLTRYFPALKDLWAAEIDDFIKAGLEETIGHEFIMWREENPIEKIMTELAREQVATVSLDDPGYPKLLREINDPPHTLFIRGTLPKDEQPTVAIVGTRKCTGYGRQMAEDFATQLVAQGIAVVSGLALGIDGIAHEAALKAGGVTVAVLGSGVDRGHVYPAAHQRLAEEIVSHGGAVVSEYPPGFMPTQYSFPARNRVIAGLSLGTLIIEAPTESGALITAKCALDYNREVFAIPHPLTSAAGQGGNNLLKLGAAMVATAQDILDALQLKNIKEIISNNQTLPASPTEAHILEHLSKEPQHIDALIKLSGLASGVVTGTLTMMEMKGKVKNVGSMMYIVR